MDEPYLLPSCDLHTHWDEGMRLFTNSVGKIILYTLLLQDEWMSFNCHLKKSVWSTRIGRNAPIWNLSSVEKSTDELFSMYIRSLYSIWLCALCTVVVSINPVNMKITWSWGSSQHTKSFFFNNTSELWEGLKRVKRCIQIGPLRSFFLLLIYTTQEAPYV